MNARFDHHPDLEHHVHTVMSGEVTLHVETLDAVDTREDPGTIMLFSEAEAPGSRWPTELLVGLAHQVGRCVWFDFRDIGASTWTDEPYSMDDLVGDARSLLEALDLGPVDVLGRSMGGEVALRLAIAQPEMVQSLVLMSTTLGRRDELGLPEEWLIEKMSERLLGQPPVDDEGRAQWLVEQWEWFNGPVFSFDRSAALVQAREEVAAGWRGPNGHGLAVMEADDIVDDLRALRIPTSIIHGTADPVLPLDHARALNAVIEDSTLTLIEGLGHELPDAFVEQLIQLAIGTR